MLIKKIKLENIRSHDNTSLEFNGGVTVFTGKTGCGKSSILMAVEYVLFGSNSVSNKALLKRGTDKGKITLEFEERGDSYIISRGLKRKKDTVASDSDSINVLVNGTKIDLVGREGDLNEYIRKILNYPSNAKNIFEVTSYTKQDEIRKLVEMRSSERQEYIDDILGVAKYLNTFKNVKPVLDHIKSKIETFETLNKELDNIREEVVKVESDILQKENKVDILSKEVSDLNEKSSSLKESTSELKKLYLNLKEKRDKYITCNTKVKNRITEVENEEKNLKNQQDLLNELNDKIKDSSDTKDLKQLNEVISAIRGKVSSLSTSMESLNRELRKFKEQGTGKCPVCLQEVTSSHVDNVDKEYNDKLKVIETEKIKLDSDLKILLEERIKSERLEEVKVLIKNKEVLIKNTTERIERLTKEKNSFLDELNTFSFSETDFKEIENQIDSSSSKELEVAKDLSSKEKELSMTKNEIKYAKDDLEHKKKRFNDIDKSKDKINKLEKVYAVLNRLREDIRSIRDVVRKKFLKDFQQSFLDNFEDIRTENEYVVDIKEDYEPVAFGNDMEVPVDHLSGGERTSVAIAYRLALAKIAAEMSSIHPSELLILDEPTTGLDKEDIKLLPNILRKIKTIPQILIVTHEDVLKEAADYKFEVNKSGGTSEVISV